MAGRRISLEGMADAKRDVARFNAQIKRGEYPEGSYVTHEACGCPCPHHVWSMVIKNNTSAHGTSNGP